MIDHLVFFAVRDDVPQKEEDDLLSSMRSLGGVVPGVLDLSVGKDFGGRSGGYTHALLARFENREDLGTYATHPAHLDVIEKLERLTTGRIVVDYES